MERDRRRGLLLKYKWVEHMSWGADGAYKNPDAVNSLTGGMGKAVEGMMNMSSDPQGGMEKISSVAANAVPGVGPALSMAMDQGYKNLKPTRGYLL